MSEAIVEDYSSDEDSRDHHICDSDDHKSLEQDNPFGLKVENLANRDGDLLPFALFSAESEGKCTWNCGYDPQGKVTSVFCFKEHGKTERVVKVFDDLPDKDAYQQALFFRNELLNNGWRKLQPPKIEFTVPDQKGGNRPLTRKEKRKLLRMKM